jgi:FkbM family methyltransferase
MAVRALDHFGALGPESVVLGVAAGVEDTLFYLTTRTKQVFATDRYLMPGAWMPLAPPVMLAEPQALAPYPFDADRLVVQHMDGRVLRYPDDMFDGIFSSGSIEHFGELQDAAYAAFEMGRVLKPGGVLSLSTEFRLSGPPGGIGWPGMTLLFSKENLLRYIVEASGLELVDDIDIDVSEETLAKPWDITIVIDHFNADLKAQREAEDPRPDFTFWEFPHLILFQEDYVFTSVHLTLRKTERYPASDNGWAKPPASVRAEISAYNRSVVAELGARPAPAPAPAATVAPPTPSVAVTPDPSVSPPATRLATVDSLLRGVDAGREAADASLGAIDRIAEELELRTSLPDVASQPDLESATWRTKDVTLREGIGFMVVLEAEGTNNIAWYDNGRVLDEHLLSLMLQLVGPGDRVLDLGAHLGVFSLAASAAGCAALAVEASPANAALLRSAVWRNGFHDLHVVNAVVAATPGTAQFLPNGPWGHVAWEPTAGAVDVPSVTVDEVVAAFGWESASFVKIDVEGSEVAALAGMARLLAGPDAPPVLYESNAHTLELAGSSPHELVGALDSLGYVNYLVDPGRLTRIGPGDIQIETVSNCIALKRRPPGLSGWIVSPRMTDEERLAKVLVEAGHDNPHCRRYMAGALATFDESFLALPQVVTALAALRDDPQGDVRAAAAWSTEREKAGAR